MNPSGTEIVLIQKAVDEHSRDRPPRRLQEARELTLFENASMQIRSGSITGLQGPNGSGKSVLFKMIVGLNRPDQGVIELEPSLQGDGRDFPTDVGIVIDRPAYIGGMTGLGNLVDLARIRRLITEDEAAAAMERVGLDPEAPQKVRDYSLGMKQKLSIAQAFMEGQACSCWTKRSTALMNPASIGSVSCWRSCGRRGDHPADQSQPGRYRCGL